MTLSVSLDTTTLYSDREMIKILLQGKDAKNENTGKHPLLASKKHYYNSVFVNDLMNSLLVSTVDRTRSLNQGGL
jgi:hypothetical protein